MERVGAVKKVVTTKKVVTSKNTFCEKAANIIMGVCKKKAHV